MKSYWIGFYVPLLSGVLLVTWGLLNVYLCSSHGWCSYVNAFSWETMSAGLFGLSAGVLAYKAATLAAYRHELKAAYRLCYKCSLAIYDARLILNETVAEIEENLNSGMFTLNRDISAVGALFPKLDSDVPAELWIRHAHTMREVQLISSKVHSPSRSSIDRYPVTEIQSDIQRLLSSILLLEQSVGLWSERSTKLLD